MEKQFNAITDWQRKTFKAATALSKVEHLIEEVQELKEDIKSQNPNRGHEYADCLFLLFGAAKADGFEYEDLVRFTEEKLEINKKRKWGTPDSNGVVKHVE